MKVIKVSGDFAKVESGRLLRTVNVQMLAGLRKGDYILVHAGFAIEKIDPERAKETLRLVSEIR
jgi:hydrogenase expression/formation protein HypC